MNETGTTTVAYRASGQYGLVAAVAAVLMLAPPLATAKSHARKPPARAASKQYLAPPAARQMPAKASLNANREVSETRARRKQAVPKPEPIKGVDFNDSATARDTVALTGAGRTDSGVHAEHMAAHFQWDDDLDADDLRYRLNAALPEDIIVRSIVEADPEFHARYSAIQRCYEYRIETNPNPFDRDRHWYVPYALDFDSLHRAAGELLGPHDFRGFCLSESQKDDCRCEISRSEWIIAGSRLRYRVSANRFLHQMVRLMVGTMVDIARGRFDAEQIQRIISNGDVSLCGPAAPPHGLTLRRIIYPGESASEGNSVE